MSDDGRDRLPGRWVQVGSHRLFVRTGGPARTDGPPAVLIAGLVMSSRYLSPTALRLATRRLVVSPDLPGAGRSPHPPDPLSIPELADLVHGLGTGRAVVVANSFGCQVAVELALRHPEAVARLVLTSPVVAPRVRSLLPVAARWIAAMRKEPLQYLRIMAGDAARAWSRKGFANVRALLAYPIEARAAQLAVPVVVVRGDRDPLVPARFARRLAHRIPLGQYVELPAPHALPYDAPEAVAGIVLDC